MNIIELANSIDRNNKTLEDTISWNHLYELFQNYSYPWPDDQNTRLKCYWLQCWYCTDSWVGRRAYFLDDKLICVSYQGGRKSEEHFEFVTKEAAKELKDYLDSLLPEEDNPFGVNVIIPETAEIPERYKIEFSGQLMAQFHKFGYLNGELVEIIGAANDYKQFHLIKYKGSDGIIHEGHVQDIEFEYGKTFEGNINRIK
jgi:hypothetical protein